MEEVDLTLVATQKKAIMALAKAEGFDPAQFEWQTAIQDETDRDYAVTFRNTISVLVHKKTTYFFRFEKYRSKYSPGHQLRTNIKQWDRLIDRDEHLRDWLFNLRSGDRTGSTVYRKRRACAGEATSPQPSASGDLDLNGPARPKAFVSHAAQDHAFVEKFATDLRSNGVDAWYSAWEIKPGDSIRQKIDEGLEGCEFFIIVLSKNSISRPWVQTELDAATIGKLNGRVRRIIPIKIEHCGDLPPTLGSLCWEDFSTRPYESALKRVLDSIFDVDVRPPLGQPQNTTSSAERSTEQSPEIVAADWGTGGTNYKDKKDLLVGYLESETPDLRASNRYFHDDYPNEDKHLIVRYRWPESSEVKTRTFAQNDRITFS